MNNIKQPKTFEELGYIFFGPLLYNFFLWLDEESSGSDKILFNSREGFFLEKLYRLFRKKDNLADLVYFKTSRKLSSIVACVNPEDIYNTFQHHRYYGKLSSLLTDRFGINPNIDTDYVLDTRMSIPNLDLYVDEILYNAERVRNEYSKYVFDVVGDSKKILMVDSGYQGTTQYYIQKAYGLTFKGRYITFKGNKYLTDVKGLYDFNTTQFPQNIIFFESVFTDSVGTYIDIDNGCFVNEDIEENTHFFNEKEQIVAGIAQFILDEKIISIEQADYIFNLMCTRDFVQDKKLMDIFYHDNYYTRDRVRKIITK